MRWGVVRWCGDAAHAIRVECESAAVNTWGRDGSCLRCVSSEARNGAKAARTFEKVLDDFVGVVLPIKQHCHQLFVASLELNKTQRRRREKVKGALTLSLGITLRIFCRALR